MPKTNDYALIAMVVSILVFVELALDAGSRHGLRCGWSGVSILVFVELALDDLRRTPSYLRGIVSILVFVELALDGG